MALLSWRVVHDGKTPPPGAVVRPDERLSWPRTVGLGAQHVVAMFGATFVFPIIMGLNPQLAIMMSGIATICFLLIVRARCRAIWAPRRRSSAASSAIRAQGGDSAEVTGAILVAGVVLAPGRRAHPLPRLPGAARGAAAGGHRRGGHADRLQPGPGGGRPSTGRRTSGWPWLTMAFVIVVAVGFRGFIGRIAVFLGLIFGYLLSGCSTGSSGPITSFGPAPPGEVTTHDRVNWAGVRGAPLVRLPAADHRSAGRPGDRRLAPARLQVRLHAAGAAGRDRAHRGERRPRQGGRRDDRHRPRPGDGPGDRRRRRRHRAHQLGRRLADHDLRREHRRHGGDPDLLHRRVLRGRARGDPVRLLARSSARSSRPPRAACSAASRWCCTA